MKIGEKEVARVNLSVLASLEGVSAEECMQACMYLNPEVKSGERVKVRMEGNKVRVGIAQSVGTEMVTVSWLGDPDSSEEVAVDKVDHYDALRCTSHQIQVCVRMCVCAHARVFVLVRS